MGIQFETNEQGETIKVITHANGSVERLLDRPAPVVQSWLVTKLAFRLRFSAAEKAAIEFAALDNPAGTQQQRLQAAGLRASLADQAVATYIDLQRSDTRAAVQALETAGLIAPGRATQILDTPPTDAELYRG